jgi:uncharacterized repeat protein (TIGR01451 family)
VTFSTTTVLVLARPISNRLRVEGILRWAVLVSLACGLPAVAQERPVHWLHAGAMPPGAIGSLRLHRGGPLLGYFQPVRIRVPQGARIALAMEGSVDQWYPDELLAGAAIGSVYRFSVADIPNYPNVEIFPTVELIDRLYPPPGLALRYPIPIELTLEELELAAGGAFVTRVIYIEDPHQALPVNQNRDADQPWFEAATGDDPLVAADRFGRPVAILRIGGRVPSATGEPGAWPQGVPPLTMFDPSQVPNADEVIGWSAEATIITDTDPAICGACGPVVDANAALVGPGDEYLCDGGDFYSPAGVRADWRVEGLEQEDAIAHYDTVDGRVVVTPSNRVCIYAPRFAAVRRVVNVMAHEQPLFVNAFLEEESPARADESQPVASSLQRHAVVVNRAERPATLFRQRQQAGGLERLLATMDVFDSLAAYANLQIIRTGEVSNAERPLVERAAQAAVTLTGVQAPQVVFGAKAAHEMAGVRQVGIIYQTDEPHSPLLRLLKLASRGHALPGEEVEFTLRFDNVGDQVIGNVTIVDNLSTRFEYVAETAQSSVDANFVTEVNDGSLILRWEITNPVEPGEGGVLRFRVRVR